MDPFIPILTGFTLGCIHALDVDHVVAVTAFATRNPAPARAAKFGLMWGLGHTATLLIFGLVSLALKVVIPPMIESLAELLVGVLLVGIGGWVIAGLLRRRQVHIHKHSHDGVEHVHFHSHRGSPDHMHAHSLFFVGATHGFAGTASVMVIIPITISQSVPATAAYLLLFGLGTIVAMAAFALLLGKVSSAASVRRVLPFVQGSAGVASIAIGFFWIGHQVL